MNENDNNIVFRAAEFESDIGFYIKEGKLKVSTNSNL